MDVNQIPEVDKKRRTSLKAEIEKVVEEREKASEEIEHTKQRRKSIKTEIEKAAEERLRIQEEKDQIKEIAKNKLFPELQKEVEAHHHQK